MVRLLAIDGNWYLHRCWFTLRTNREIGEALAYSFVGLIMKDACAVKATHILVAFDGPNGFRHKIFPDYKANRGKSQGATGDDGEEAGKDIYSYLPTVRAYLEKSGLVWIQPRTHEADDVMASVAFQFGSPGTVKVIMGSKDKDGYQSLGQHVVAYDSTAEPPRIITAEMAEKSKGVKVSQMVMYQTLIGDKIDNIPSLKPPAQAKKAINKWGSFKVWFAKGSTEDKVWLRANQVKLALNKKLVEMATGLTLPPLNDLKVPKLERPDMPRAWYAYRDMMYPKAKGLFGKR